MVVATRGKREEQKVQRRRRAALCYHLYQQGLSLREVALRTGYASAAAVQNVILETFGEHALTGIELPEVPEAPVVVLPEPEDAEDAESPSDVSFFLPDDLGPTKPGTQPRMGLPTLDTLLAGFEVFAKTGGIAAAPQTQPEDDDETLREEREWLEYSWSRWLTTLFPLVFSSRTGVPMAAPFAAHHGEFWEWVWRLSLGEPIEPFIAIWSRGGGKSTGAELACVAAAARGARRYGLYVCRTQDQADGHVAAVASHLESEAFTRLYPKVADRAVGKYGFSRGWRHNRLSCASGFTLDALGLDKSVRGVKVESDRPDFIVLDDIDSDTDSDMMVERQINKLARRVLPTAGADAGVLFVQNLVHSRSLAARLTLPFDGVGGPLEPADILHSRQISGPHPALLDFAYEQNPKTGRYFITSGDATWSGQDKESCQRFIDRYGITAFRVECQHEDVAPERGLFAKVLFRRVRQDQLPGLTRIVCWIDPSVTDKDSSDSCGIIIAGLGEDNMVYILWSWERRSSPQAVLKLAITQALFYQATEVGVETDQGGDLWRVAYNDAVNELIAERGDNLPYPVFREQKAGAGHGPKVHRASLMMTDYERGRIIHVIGTHETLESGLRRFPVRKPYDLVDAAYWAWNDLRAGSGLGVHFW